MSAAPLGDLLKWAARQVYPKCRVDEVPSLGDLGQWWSQVSQRAADYAHHSLRDVLGARWYWAVAREEDEPAQRPRLVALAQGGAHLSLEVRTVAAVHEAFLKTGAPHDEHPLLPIVRAWFYERRSPGSVFMPGTRASLPRLHSAGNGEGASGLLFTDPPSSGNRQLVLPFGGGDHADFEVVDCCPSWLLEMYAQAQRGAPSSPRGLAWSFRLVVGGLVHLDVRERDGRMRDLELSIDSIIDWLDVKRGGRWANRARDYSRLAAALEETHQYRVTLSGMRYWLVSAYGVPEVYGPDASCVLTVRTPPGAAAGMRIDWDRFRREASSSAIRARAYLGLMALLDRSARNGVPITRLIRAPVPAPDGGGSLRGLGGRVVRSGALVPNPAARYAAFLPDRDLAAFLGMASTRKARHDARAAVVAFTQGPDAVVELVPERGGWRVFSVQSESSSRKALGRAS